MSHRAVAVSRRAALGLAAGGLALAGCDAGSPPRAEREGVAPAPDPEDPDADLVAEAAVSVAYALGVARRAQGRPAIAGPVRALVRMHTAHLASLGRTPGPDREVPERGPDQRVRRQLADVETDLRQQLTSAAGRALSGDLAALFATMTAGVAQHAAVLSR